MSTIPKLTSAIRNAQAELIIAELDGETGAGSIAFYAASTTPASVDDALPGDAVLLVECALSDPCGTATAGVITFSAIANGTAVADGTMRFARIRDALDVAHVQVDVGEVGSGAAIILNDTAIVTDGVLAFTDGLTITIGV